MKFKLTIKKLRGQVVTQTNFEEKFLDLVNELDFEKVRRVTVEIHYADKTRNVGTYKTKHDLLIAVPAFLEL